MCAVKMVQSASQSVKKSTKCSKRGGGGQRRFVKIKLDPVGLTVRYEVMKLCMGQYEAVLPIPYWRLTDWQMSKDRAPQLFISVRVELS